VTNRLPTRIACFQKEEGERTALLSSPEIPREEKGRGKRQVARGYSLARADREGGRKKVLDWKEKKK